MSDLRTDTPAFDRALAAAVQFLDVFTGLPVQVPFTVSIPVLRWTALRWDADATYRFTRANVPRSGGLPQFPTGTFDLEIDTGGDRSYAALEPREIALPVTLPHPPPVLATDYLAQLTLWPTVAFRAPQGETAVTAQLVSASSQPVADLKVRLFDPASPPPASIYTRADSNGQLLVRLPSLRRGSALNPTATLTVEVFDATNTALTVTPASLTVPIGQQTGYVTLTVP